MPMPITIRPLEHDDIPRIMEIEHRCFDSAVWESVEIYEERIDTYPLGNLGFFHGDILIGFLWCELWKHEQRYDLARFELSHHPRQFHDPNGTELYISSFAVDPHYRHLLRGKEAFSLGMARMQQTYPFETAILLVSEHWHAARTIYTQWGFSEVQRIEGFFADASGRHHPGILMRTTSR